MDGSACYTEQRKKHKERNDKSAYAENVTLEKNVKMHKERVPGVKESSREAGKRKEWGRGEGWVILSASLMADQRGVVPERPAREQTRNTASAGLVLCLLCLVFLLLSIPTRLPRHEGLV